MNEKAQQPVVPYTLLLRLAGPMQSWGTRSRFSYERDTEREPSKSGVIGLLAAAQGRPRDAPVADLAALTMGVRIDRPGSLKVDYHTVGGTNRKGDTYGVAEVGGGVRTAVTHRYYLADASFLVGLQGDEALLRTLDAALADPVWPLSLGRRAFVPSEPIRLPDEPPLGPGLRPGAVEDVLRTYWPPCLDLATREDRRRTDERVTLVIDDGFDPGEPGDTSTPREMRRDVPISFAPASRLYDIRYVLIKDAPVPSAPQEEP